MRIAFISAMSGAAAYLGALKDPLIGGLAAFAGATLAAWIYDTLFEEHP